MGPKSELSFLDRFLRSNYHHIQEMVHGRRHNPKRARLLYFIDLGAFLYGFKFLGLTLQLWSLSSSSGHQHKDSLSRQLCTQDPFCLFFLSHLTYDPIIILFVFFFELCNFALQYKMRHLDVDRGFVWKWWYDVLAQSLDSYDHCRISGLRVKAALHSRQMQLLSRLQHSSSLGQTISELPGVRKWLQLWARCQLWLSLENVDRHRLFRRPLSTVALPEMPQRLRSQVLLFTIALEKLSALLIFITIGAYFTFIFSFMPPVMAPFYRHGLKPQLLLILFELSLILYALVRFIRTVLLFSTIALLAWLIFTRHIHQLNAAVQKLIHRSNHLRLSRFLTQIYLPSHNRICGVISSGNRDLFAAVMFIFLCTHLPVNIILLSMLKFSPVIPIVDRVIYLFIIGVQACVASIAFIPMSSMHKAVYSPLKHLGRLQCSAHLKGRLKIRLDDVTARLSYGQPKYAIAIGSQSPITYSTSVEYLLIYTGYLLVAFSQQLGLSLIKSSKFKQNKFLFTDKHLEY